MLVCLLFWPEVGKDINQVDCGGHGQGVPAPAPFLFPVTQNLNVNVIQERIMAEPTQCYLTFVIDLMDVFHWWTISPGNSHSPVLPMAACYVFNGKDKLLPSRGLLPAKLFGNCLLLKVKVLLHLELSFLVGGELCRRMGWGRLRGAKSGLLLLASPSSPTDRLLLGKWALKDL